MRPPHNEEVSRTASAWLGRAKRASRTAVGAVRRGAQELKRGRQFVRAAVTGQAFGGQETLRLTYYGRERLVPDFDFLFGATPERRISERHHLTGYLRSSLRLPQSARADVDATDLMFSHQVPDHMLLYATHLLAHLEVDGREVRQLAGLSPQAQQRWQAADAAGLTHKATRAPEDFEHFYLKMYAEADRARFGDSGATYEHAPMRAIFDSGGTVLQVRKNDEVRSAVLVHTSKHAPGVLFYDRPGVAHSRQQSDDELATLSMAHAMAMLRFAREQHLRKIDFGLTRAVANNVMFLHKQALGCHFKIAPHCPHFGLLLSPWARHDLMRRVPLIVPRPGGDLAVYDGSGFAPL